MQISEQKNRFGLDEAWAQGYFILQTLITFFFLREGSGRWSKYMTVKVLDSSETSKKYLAACNRKWVGDFKLNYFLEIHSSGRR